MADLTREEIRRACEAAGNPWDPAVSGYYEMLLADATGVSSDGAALALLEATGLEWCVGRINSSIIKDPYWAWIGDDLETKVFDADIRSAAVRAVNAWAESQERKTL